MAVYDTNNVHEIADDFIEAGWLYWDIEDAFFVIDDALQYLDEHDSL